MTTCTKDNHHLTLPHIRRELEQVHRRNAKQKKALQYLSKTSIPTHPRPELHVSHVSHCTDLTGLEGIQRDGGFKDTRTRQFVWFSLMATPDELQEALTREMTVVHSGGREQKLQRAVAERKILQKFATSPAFKSSSRYGSFRFTFHLRDVLETYKQQFCGGQEPVLRVYRTIMYTQEVMYVVLVHSPATRNFSNHPLLPGSETTDCICTFSAEPEPHFIWRPQAMSEKHRFSLEVNYRNLSTEEFDRRNNWEYYVWDHAVLALHVGYQVLRFEEPVLRENLRFCKKGELSVRENTQYQTHAEAQRRVRELWPNQLQAGRKMPLEKFNTSRFHICPRGSDCKLPRRCIC